jgi:hypothetical protein
MQSKMQIAVALAHEALPPAQLELRCQTAVLGFGPALHAIQALAIALAIEQRTQLIEILQRRRHDRRRSAVFAALRHARQLCMEPRDVLRKLVEMPVDETAARERAVQ